MGPDSRVDTFIFCIKAFRIASYYVETLGSSPYRRRNTTIKFFSPHELNQGDRKIRLTKFLG
jgi:hypothetical protein